MKVRPHLDQAKCLLNSEEREELARKVYEIRSVNYLLTVRECNMNLRGRCFGIGLKNKDRIPHGQNG